MRNRKIKEEEKTEEDCPSVDEAHAELTNKAPAALHMKMYFNLDTQNAIVQFQSEKDGRKREEIYVTQIMPAFEKLVENLINIYKFSGMHDSNDDLKNDCVNFLFETVHKFDASRGTKAFSYFNVVAKNWLIVRTRQKSMRIKKHVSVEDTDSLTLYDVMTIEKYNTVPSQDETLDSEEKANRTLRILQDIRSKVRTENELTCINSIITIFENMDNIDLLNKRAVLLYMRELSRLSPKQLTSAMQSIKKHYEKSKKDEDES